MHYCHPLPSPAVLAAEARCLEAVIVSVGFADLLDVTLGYNHAHFDAVVVVTSNDDAATQSVARKHGAILAITDLHKKNGRHFNKGAAINAGLARCQFHGWRAHLDADIIVPDNFRRILLNHSALDPQAIYGADRVDIVGAEHLDKLSRRLEETPQSAWSCMLHPRVDADFGSRYMDPLFGWVPIGFFQLWHSSCANPYPYSLGTAQHDDVLFASQWPREQRRLLPTAIMYHLCSRKPRLGENWDGHRRQPKFDRSLTPQCGA